MHERSRARSLAAATLTAALVGCLALALPMAQGAKKSAKAKTKTFATSLNTPIPDGGDGAVRTEHTVRAPLDVTGIPNKAKIKDVNVQIRTQKTGAQAANRDLEIHLATPRGVIRLSTDNGDVSDGYGSGSTSCAGGLVSFDSQAGTSILNAPAGTQTNTTGTFAPEESLNVLRGLKGTKAKVPWTLIVADDDAVGTQSLHCFQLEIKYKKKGKKKK